MTFSDAEKYCASFGSHLIEIFTQEQRDFLKQKIITIHSTVWTNLNAGYVWWLNLGNFTFHFISFYVSNQYEIVGLFRFARNKLDLQNSKK